jgi:hypothetical protein
VAFDSYATTLVAGEADACEDEHGYPEHCGADVLVRDRLTGTTVRESPSIVGAETSRLGVENPAFPAITPDGHYVAFASALTTPIANHVNYNDDVFVRDRVKRTTEVVSVGLEFAPRGRLSGQPWPPRAGRDLRVAISARELDRLVPISRVHCAATLSGRPLRAAEHNVVTGRKQCDWRIPNDEATPGRRLALSVSATTAYGTGSKHLTVTVG